MGVTMFMVTPLSIACRSSSRKLLYRRSGVVVDQDVGVGQALSSAAWPSAVETSASTGVTWTLQARADLLGGLFEQRLIATVDHKLHAGLGQRLGATLAQTLARRADDGGSAADA